MEIETIVRLVALAMAGVLGWVLMGISRNVKSYLALRFTAEELAIAKETALMVVSTLKQSPAFEYIQPEKKKELAIIWLIQAFKKYGLQFTAEEIDYLIEEAVSIIKGETEGYSVLGEIEETK
jgi:hypothetical protein